MTPSFGKITVAVRSDRILECVSHGFVRLEHVLAAQAEIESIGRRFHGTFDALFDGSESIGFEPALPIRWVRWGARFVDRVGKFAIVARPGPLMGIATTLPYLLPTWRIGLFSDRGAAVAFLQAANDAAARR